MNKLSCLFIFLICVACAKYDAKPFIKNIDGYWEIERVILSDGSEKKYNFNKSIDFFEIKDTLGVRKKLQPKLDGSFISTNDRQLFTLHIKNDSLRMHYQNHLSKWIETVILAKEDQLIIKNEAGNTYFYKPYHKIKL